MTRTFLLLTFMLAYKFIVGQEMVPSEISVNTFPVSECNSCNGGIEISIDVPGVKTFSWFNENNDLVFSESKNENWSLLDNLCIGSYYIEISQTSLLINSIWVSVSEQDVDIELFGELYVCSSSDEIDLNSLELTNTTTGGSWVGSNDQAVNEISIEQVQASDYYSYQINNEGCINSVIYPVHINNPANSGDGTTYIICEDFEEFELIEPMAGDPEENGVWYDSDNNVSDGFFNPETDDAEQFTYLIDSVLGCPVSFSTLQIVKNVIPYAGENGAFLACEMLDESVQLFEYLNGEPESAGVWYDMNNQQIEGVFDSSTMEEGLYRYTVQGNVPCPADIAYVNVEFIDELIAGDGGMLQVCSSSAPLEMSSLLAEGVTDGGVWINDGGNQVLNEFNPALENSQTFSYHLSGLGCETVQSNFIIEVEQFESAGTDQSIEFCEFSDQIDLNSFLSLEASSSGVWMLDGEILETSVFSGLPIQEIFTYSLNHDVCENESSSIELTIYENPLFPSLSNINLCENSGIVILDELANIEDEWLTSWLNLDSNIEESVFDSHLGVSGNYQLAIDPQNICGSDTIEISIELEANVFENTNLVFEFCSSESDLDISYLIQEEIGSNNFALQNFPNIISASDYLGTSLFQVVETNLDECEPSTVSVELNIVEFNDVNPDFSETLCEAQENLDLEDYNAENGDWYFNNELLESMSIQQSEENSGAYLFQPNNHPVCPQLSQLIELQFQEPFEMSELPNQTLCFGESISLLSPLNGSGFSTEWLIGSEISTGSLLTLNSADIQLGDNEVSFSVSNGVCQDSSSLILTVNPLPEFEILTANSYCSGDTISLNVTTEIIGEVSWFIEGVLESSASELELEATESMLITASVLDENSCFYESQEQLLVYQSPEIQISMSPQELCAPLSVTLACLTGSSEQDHYWSVNGETINEPLINLELSPGDQTDVYLTAVSENGCVTQIGQDNYLIGNPVSIAEFSLSSLVISDISQPIEVLNQSQNSTQAEWFLNTEFLNSEDQFELVFNYLNERSNELCLEVNNIHNCPDTICKVINSISELTVYMPNAFSPDNDGLNEIFKPVMYGHSEEDYELLVFDRWGELIFRSDTASEGWNGSVDGGEHYAASGIYSYILTVKEEYSQEKSQHSGSVMLLR